MNSNEIIKALFACITKNSKYARTIQCTFTNLKLLILTVVVGNKKKNNLINFHYYEFR